jgi:hypothetical protein
VIERERLGTAHGLELVDSEGPVFWDYAGDEDVVASVGTLQ